MTSNEPYAAAASQVRKATEQSADAWKEGTKKLFDQVGTIPTMPQVDLNQPVEQYFDFVQRTVDLNRELATKWAQRVNTLSGAARERAESFSRIVKGPSRHPGRHGRPTGPENRAGRPRPGRTGRAGQA
jgi:hypothetical protein